MKKIEKQSQKIIDSYLKDLKIFLKENNLDKGLSKDIQERIEEKLEEKKQINTSEVQNILEEIGTPEEIFAEELSENTNNSQMKKNIFGKFISRQNDIIFLGVFKELGDTTNVPAIFYRILFLLLLTIGFLADPIDIGISLFLLYFLGFLLLRTRFFGFLFSITLFSIFIGILVLSVILFGAYLGDFSIGNMHPFMGISPFFPIGMVIGIFSLVILIIVSFRYGFLKKFSLKLFTTGLVMAITAITFGGAVIFDFIGKYTSENEFIKEVEINVNNEKEITLAGTNFSINKNSSLLAIETINYTIYPWNFKKSSDDKIHLKYKISFRGNKQMKEKGKKYIQEIIPTIENGILSTLIKTDTENKYPFIPMDIHIESIEIPEDIIFNIDSWSDNQKIEVDEKYKILEKYRFFCKKGIFKQSSELAQCIIDDTNEKKYYKSAISYFLYNQGLENFIPLKFSKRHYNWDWDWSGEYNLENNNYHFRVSDGQAKFSIQVQIIEDKEKQVFELKDTKIISYHGDINKNWYKNPEILEKITHK